MKPFITGLLTIIAVAVVGIVTYKYAARFMAEVIASPSPSASSSPTPTPSVTPSPTPKSTPAQTYNPTKKSGKSTPIVANKIITNDAPEHFILTILKTNVCPSDYRSEITGIVSDVTLKYVLKDGYSANITAWKKNGEEVIAQREIRGSGELKKVSGTDYLKLEIQSKDCNPTSDTWLTLTAER